MTLDESSPHILIAKLNLNATPKSKFNIQLNSLDKKVRDLNKTITDDSASITASFLVEAKSVSKQLAFYII